MVRVIAHGGLISVRESRTEDTWVEDELWDKNRVD